MSDSDSPVFVDTSALLNYCRVYSGRHRSTEQVINYLHNEKTGDIYTSRHGKSTFENQIENRYRLLGHLFHKASDFEDRDDKDESDFIAEILNYTDLDQQLPFGLDDSYESDIGSLKDLLRDIGLSEFKSRMYKSRGECNSYQESVELWIIDEYYDRGDRGHWDFNLFLQSTVGPENAERVMDAIYWSREHSSDFVIAGGDGEIFNKREEINRLIRNNLSSRDELNIICPESVAKSSKVSIT